MTTVSSLFQNFLPQQQPQDAFMAGLNQLGGQVAQLNAQVQQAGASARSNGQLIGAFNALVGQVQQYQQAVTQAGANTNPAYQQALNGIAAQLNQVLAVLNGQAAPASQQTDAFSSGLNQLAMQVTQLQAHMAAAGASAAQNPQLRQAHQQLTTSVNAYLNALRNAGPQYASSPMMAQLNDMAGKLAQMQYAFNAPAPASYPAQPQYPGYPPQPQYPQTSPGWPQPGIDRPRHRRHRGDDGPRRNGGDQAMQIIGTIAGIAGALSGRQPQPVYPGYPQQQQPGWQFQIR